MLDFDGHRPPVLQDRLMDLSQGGSALRSLLKGDEELRQLRDRRGGQEEERRRRTGGGQDRRGGQEEKTGEGLEEEVRTVII